MVSDENVLYTVLRRNWLGGPPTQAYVFRTRSAARKFINSKKKDLRNNASRFNILRMTWGPEQ